MQSYEVYVCGSDSRDGHQFLESLNAHIFGYDNKTIQQAFDDVKHVDLCIVINRADPLTRLAILGEVEGNKGAKMLRGSFWTGTASFCAFGVGVVLNNNKQMEIQTINTPTGPKSVLTMSSAHHVAADSGAEHVGSLADTLFLFGKPVRASIDADAAPWRCEHN
jgi:hypothetical protein